MILIRRAYIKDAAVIASLGSKTFTETFGNLFPPPGLEQYLLKTFSVEKISRSLTKQNNIYWVAYLDEIPVGYAKVKLNSKIVGIDLPGQIQLQKIYVLKEYLDKKIGSALMNEILKSEHLNACSLLWLVVLHSNERAIRFYEKYGFKILKTHFHQIGTINFEYKIMTKEL